MSETFERVRLSMATALNGAERNEDAIGLDGWILHGDNVDPLSVHRWLGTDRSVAVAVADGLSTGPDGDRAAQVVARRLTDKQLHRHADPEGGTLGTAFKTSHAALLQSGGTAPEGMGASAALVILRPDGLVLIGHVGDVRVYLRRDGYVSPLTRDDRLDTAKAVSRCLGGAYATTVQWHPNQRQLRSTDRLLLCSAGLHDALRPEDLEEALRIDSADHAVVALVKTALGHGTGNVTAVVLDPVRSPARVGPVAAKPVATAAPPPPPPPQRSPPVQQRPELPPTGPREIDQQPNRSMWHRIRHREPKEPQDNRKEQP